MVFKKLTALKPQVGPLVLKIFFMAEETRSHLTLSWIYLQKLQSNVYHLVIHLKHFYQSFNTFNSLSTNCSFVRYRNEKKSLHLAPPHHRPVPQIISQWALQWGSGGSPAGHGGLQAEHCSVKKPIKKKSTSEKLNLACKQNNTGESALVSQVPKASWKDRHERSAHVALTSWKFSLYDVVFNGALRVLLKIWKFIFLMDVVCCLLKNGFSAFS